MLLSSLLFCLTGCAKTAEYAQKLVERAGSAIEEVEIKMDIITLDGVEKYSDSAMTENVNSFESAFHSFYAYDSLSEAEKLWYDDINGMLAGRSEEAVVLSKEGFEKGLSEEDIDKIYECVLIDHPEYFFVEGYEYTTYFSWGKLAGIEIKGTYNLSMVECLARKAQIDAAVEKILSLAPTEGSAYEKIKYVYETIVYNTEYCMDAEDNQNIYSVFVGQASVCQGYAKATQYLLNCLGVECTLVYGKVNSAEGHSWNLVEIGDAFYYVDTTWGDASYLAKEQEAAVKSEMPDINYDYLCITTEQLLKTHTIEHELELPLCEAVEHNYYRMEGCYFEQYNEAQVSREFYEAAGQGRTYVTLKCSDAAIYEELLHELVENQKVFVYLNENSTSIAYIENEQQLSLTFWMTN